MVRAALCSPQGPISAAVSSSLALALSQLHEGMVPLGRTQRVTLVVPPHPIPPSHPPSPLGRRGEQSCQCVRGAPNPHPKGAWSSLAGVRLCLLALPDRFQSSCSFQESSPFLLLQLLQELDYQALGMPQIFACLKQQTLSAQGLWVQPCSPPVLQGQHCLWVSRSLSPQWGGDIPSARPEVCWHP